MKVYQYAYEGGPQYVIPCYSDKLIEEINVINEPDNILDITVNGVTVANGVQNRFTLYVKDKAGNELTQTVFTDAAGNLSITVNDPDNMGGGSRQSAAAMSTTANATGNIYTFLLNDTITVNLNMDEPEPETYTVFFESNGGTEIDSFSGYTGDLIEAPGAAPAKDGYSFAGWYLDLELALPVTWPYTIGEADVTFYAKWNQNSAYMLGDVNMDGSINALDALITLKAASGSLILNEIQLLAADVNRDGFITTLDALKILQYTARKITAL